MGGSLYPQLAQGATQEGTVPFSRNRSQSAEVAGG